MGDQTQERPCDDVPAARPTTAAAVQPGRLSPGDEPRRGTPRTTGDGQRALHDDDGPTPVNAVPSMLRLHAALAAARAGLYVFPVRPYGKTPAVRDWEHTATTDPSAITAWWAARPYNIGIATGPSRLLVVDLDTARGATPPPRWAGACGGEDVLHALAANAGQRY